ncbi:MAG: hypothetical protein LUE64_00830, partial [Candidatus Gastranaerophilales bacterium]|nr:hypothetical protein [Candidatus Gastranaerophilales bacterium]
MRVYQQQYSDISIYKSPSKTRLKEHNEQYSRKNKEELQQVRPAGQTSLSGSERSGDISFTGDPRLVTKIAKEALSGSDFSNVSEWAKKMGGAGWFDKVLKSVNENEAFYEAIVALVVAGMLKPICVLAMPGAEKEDKQMSATKNAVSAGAGFIISNLILGPCSKAVNKITDSFETSNPTKYIKNAEYVRELTNDELIEYTTKSGTAKKLKSTLGDAFKTAYKKFPDMGVSPLKASITIALTPYVLNILFGKNKKKDKTPKTD